MTNPRHSDAACGRDFVTRGRGSLTTPIGSLFLLVKRAEIVATDSLRICVMVRHPSIADGEWRIYRVAETIGDADDIIDEAEARPTGAGYRVAVERHVYERRWLCDACREPSCVGHGGWDDGETP